MNPPSWELHYNDVSGKSLTPASTLSFALEQFNTEQVMFDRKVAIDLGFGSGIDSMFLLSNNWQVTAIDKEPAASTHLKHLVSPVDAPRLTIVTKPFEEAILPPALLVNATFSLPFCSPQYFPSLWKNILKALQPGGRFAGHFFGIKDSWANRDDMTFHTHDLLQELFAGFSIEQFEETKREGKTLSGALKHWHVFHVVAQYQ